jgi:hypothetical protein
VNRTVEIRGYTSPVSHYPKRKLGKAEIGKSRRGRGSSYWMEGVRGYTIGRYTTSAQITTLKIGGQVWMTDEPMYVWSLESFAERSYGSVLVAGLGLGIVVHQLLRNPSVTEVNVVELEKDVIRLVQPLLPQDKRLHVLHDDFNWFVDRVSTETEYVPDTIIWDLAVRQGKVQINCHQMPFLKLLLQDKFGPKRWNGKKWVERKDPKDVKVFVHGLDRDPVGEAFVKTEEFMTARSQVSP